MGRGNVSGADTVTYNSRGNAEGARDWGGCSIGGGACVGKRWWLLELQQLQVAVRV